MKTAQKYLWLLLFCTFGAYAKKGGIIIFDKIDGLEIGAHSVETTAAGEDWLVVSGEFKNEGWTLFLEGSPVKINSGGKFTVKSKYSGIKHSLRFVAKDSAGKEQVESLNFTEGDKDDDRHLSPNEIYSHLGFGFYRYRQGGFIEQSSSDLTLTVGAIRRLPNTLELGIEGTFNLVNLTNSSGIGAGYRDFSLHATYPFSFRIAKRPARVLVGLQMSYSTMSVLLDAYGYQNITGEGPRVTAEFNATKKLLVETGLSFLLLNRDFGFSSYAFTASVGSRFQVSSTQALGVHLSYLNLQDNTANFARHSTFVNCSYRISF